MNLVLNMGSDHPEIMRCHRSIDRGEAENESELSEVRKSQ